MEDNVPGSFLPLNPVVTVIVTCYNRKKYLLSALMSLKNQTIDPDLFEVILVKNFKDESIEKFLEDSGFRSINANDGPIGLYMSIGVNEAKGEIIAFLEDDDLFEKNKVDRLINIFKDQSVVYYHNSHFLIDEDGKKIRGSEVKPPNKLTEVYINNSLELRKVLKRLGVYGLGSLYFNPSSVAIRKEIIKKADNFLKTLHYRPDDFLFYTALRYSGTSKMIFDLTKLTYYRKHASTSNPGANITDKLSILKIYEIGTQHIIKMLENCWYLKYAYAQLGILTDEISFLSPTSENYKLSVKKSAYNMWLNNEPKIYIILKIIIYTLHIKLPKLAAKLKGYQLIEKIMELSRTVN